MTRRLHPVAPLLAIGLVSGCLSDSGQNILAIDATGAVAGVFFVDRNGDGTFTPATDVAAPRMSFAVVRGDRDTVAVGTTDEAGKGIARLVEVGSYRVVVDPLELGDSLQQAGSGTEVTVERDDTATALVAVQYRNRTVREVRSFESGRIVAIEGVALNAWTTYGDSTVHVADSTGAVRAVRAPASPVTAGDSVRVVGRTADVDGDRVLKDALILSMGVSAVPVPTGVTTGEAASARSSSLAAALVRIEDARIVDSERLATGDLRIQVDDGSGILELLLDRHAGITTENPIVPGAVVDATGLLVLLPSGMWQMKPRGSTDVDVRIPTLPIVEARAVPVSQAVTVEGVALNGWSTFGDGTIHLSDASGSIRVYQSATSFVAAGDSVRFVGIMSIVAGQPLLSVLRSTHLGRAKATPVPEITTSRGAATAMDGALDAALVAVKEATILDVRNVALDVQVRVDDDSGELTVLLDRDTGISGSGLVAGGVLDVTGVLVPAASGTWILKPRRSSDLSVR